VDLTVTDDAVRRAAEACPDAKKTLEALFPQVFSPNANLVVSEQRTIGQITVQGPDGTRANLCRRTGGKWEGSIYLPPFHGYSWVVGMDDMVHVCLYLVKK